MRHLNRVANSTNTRMDSKNLATVIAPNLIRSTMATLINDVKDLNNQCSLVDLLISRYELFFEKSGKFFLFNFRACDKFNEMYILEL